MPVLKVNVPHVSREPAIRVENRLEPGRYRFRLVVVDDAENASQPADLVVEVAPRVIDPIDPRPLDPRIIRNPDLRVRPIERPPIDTRPIEPRPIEPRPIGPGILRPGRFRPNG